jgi:hypothetical protein
MSDTRRPISQGTQRPSAPPMPDSWRTPVTPSKQKCQILHWGEESCNLTLWTAPEDLLPQTAQRPSTPHWASLKESPVSSVQKLESQLLYQVAICYSAGARRSAFYSAQETQCSLLWLRESPCAPTKEQKEVKFSSNPSLRKTAGAPGEKTQNPNVWSTRD